MRSHNQQTVDKLIEIKSRVKQARLTASNAEHADQHAAVLATGGASMAAAAHWSEVCEHLTLIMTHAAAAELLIRKRGI